MSCHPMYSCDLWFPWQELAIGVSLPLWRAVREDNLEEPKGGFWFLMRCYMLGVGWLGWFEFFWNKCSWMWWACCTLVGLFLCFLIIVVTFVLWVPYADMACISEDERTKKVARQNSDWICCNVLRCSICSHSVFALSLAIFANILHTHRYLLTFWPMRTFPPLCEKQNCQNFPDHPAMTSLLPGLVYLGVPTSIARSCRSELVWW